MKNPTILHINFMEIDWIVLGHDIDTIVKKAVEWGYDGIEFRGYCPANYTGTVDEYLAEIAAAKKKYGLAHVLFGKGISDCGSDDAEKRAAGIKGAIEFYKRAQDVTGACLFNVFGDLIVHADGRIPAGCYDFGGSHFATEAMWNNTVDSYQQVGKEMEKAGIKLAFETHMNYLHDRPDTAKKLVDLIDSSAVGINMDYGNTIYMTKVPSPADTVKLYGDKLFYMHLKNSIGIGNYNRIPTSLAEGEINHRIYLKAVKDLGYTGPIGIEAPRGGDREWFARQDLAYFKAVAEEIEL